MEEQTIWLVWFIVGFISWNVIEYFLEREVTIKGLIIALVFSFLGGLVFIGMIVVVLIVLGDKYDIKLENILNKRIL